MRDDGRGSRPSPHDDQHSFNPVPPELEDRLAAHDERLYRAHEAAAEVTGLPGTERPEYVSSHPACLTPEFVELMIAMARECRGTDPDQSVRYAHLAATAAEAAFAAGSDEVDDARALAFAELGNGHRICGDLRRAGIAFGLARERARFVADPLVTVEISSLDASYLDRASEFEEAIQVLERAERLQARVGTPHGIGRLQIQRGTSLRRAGQQPQSIEALRSGIDLVDPVEDPRLLLVGVHNLADSLIEIGQPEEALGLLGRHRPMYEEVGYPTDRARLGWLEGKAACQLQLWSLAEATLEEARERFIKLDCPYETALISLDLTEPSARLHHYHKVEEAAKSSLQLCRACGVDQEGLAAAALLYDSAKRRQHSIQALTAMAATVRRHLKH